MSNSLFQRTLWNTVREVNNQKPPPPVQLTYELLLKQVTGMIHNTSDSFESYPVLYLPDGYDMESDPIILQSGQHRVEALIQLFSQTRSYSGYNDKLFTPATVSVRELYASNNC